MLPRPGKTGKTGKTGKAGNTIELGVTFVAEVMKLHHGQVVLQNTELLGVSAVLVSLEFPVV